MSDRASLLRRTNSGQRSRQGPPLNAMSPGERRLMSRTQSGMESPRSPAPPPLDALSPADRRKLMSRTASSIGSPGVSPGRPLDAMSPADRRKLMMRTASGFGSPARSPSSPLTDDSAIARMARNVQNVMSLPSSPSRPGTPTNRGSTRHSSASHKLLMALKKKPAFRTPEDTKILIRFCASNRFCRQFPKEAWPAIATVMSAQHVEAGTVLVSQGDLITLESSVYTLVEGSVDVYVNDRWGGASGVLVSQDATKVAVLRRGSVFGESGGIVPAGVHRTATVVAATPCHLATLKRMDLVALLDDPTGLFVPTTEHCQRILRNPVELRSKQEMAYLTSFVRQFKPLQELPDAAIDVVVRTMEYERYKPNALVIGEGAAVGPRVRFILKGELCVHVNSTKVPPESAQLSSAEPFASPSAKPFRSSSLAKARPMTLVHAALARAARKARERLAVQPEDAPETPERKSVSPRAPKYTGFAPPAIEIPSPATSDVSAPNSAPGSPTAFGTDLDAVSEESSKLARLYGRIVVNLVAGQLFGSDALAVDAPLPSFVDSSLDPASPGFLDALPDAGKMPVTVRAACMTEILSFPLSLFQDVMGSTMSTTFQAADCLRGLLKEDPNHRRLEAVGLIMRLMALGPSNRFFSQLPAGAWAMVAKNMTYRTFPGGSTVIKQGAHPDGFGILTQGRIRMYSTGQRSKPAGVLPSGGAGLGVEAPTKQPPQQQPPPEASGPGLYVKTLHAGDTICGPPLRAVVVDTNEVDDEGVMSGTLVADDTWDNMWSATGDAVPASADDGTSPTDHHSMGEQHRVVTVFWIPADVFRPSVGMFAERLCFEPTLGLRISRLEPELRSARQLVDLADWLRVMPWATAMPPATVANVAGVVSVLSVPPGSSVGHGTDAKLPQWFCVTHGTLKVQGSIPLPSPPRRARSPVAAPARHFTVLLHPGHCVESIGISARVLPLCNLVATALEPCHLLIVPEAVHPNEHDLRAVCPPLLDGLEPPVSVHPQLSHMSGVQLSTSCQIAFSKSPEARTEDDLITIVRAVASLPLCATLPPLALAFASQHMHVRHFDRGAVVFKQGDAADDVFVVLVGAVAVHAVNTALAVKFAGVEAAFATPAPQPKPAIFDGCENVGHWTPTEVRQQYGEILGLLRSLDTFGEAAIRADSAPRSAAVIAASPAMLLVVPGFALRRALSAASELTLSAWRSSKVVTPQVVAVGSTASAATVVSSARVRMSSHAALRRAQLEINLAQLRRNPAWRHPAMTRAVQRTIMMASSLVSMSAGTKLFTKGDAIKHVYLVLQGTVDVVCTALRHSGAAGAGRRPRFGSEDHEDGGGGAAGDVDDLTSRRRLAAVHAGSLVGEIECLVSPQAASRLLSARTGTEARLLRMPVDVFAAVWPSEAFSDTLAKMVFVHDLQARAVATQRAVEAAQLEALGLQHQARGAKASTVVQALASRTTTASLYYATTLVRYRQGAAVRGGEAPGVVQFVKEGSFTTYHRVEPRVADNGAEEPPRRALALPTSKLLPGAAFEVLPGDATTADCNDCEVFAVLKDVLAELPGSASAPGDLYDGIHALHDGQASRLARFLDAPVAQGGDARTQASTASAPVSPAGTPPASPTATLEAAMSLVAAAGPATRPVTSLPKALSRIGKSPRSQAAYVKSSVAPLRQSPVTHWPNAARPQTAPVASVERVATALATLQRRPAVDDGDPFPPPPDGKPDPDLAASLSSTWRRGLSRTAPQPVWVPGEASPPVPHKPRQPSTASPITVTSSRGSPLRTSRRVKPQPRRVVFWTERQPTPQEVRRGSAPMFRASPGRVGGVRGGGFRSGGPAADAGPPRDPGRRLSAGAIVSRRLNMY